MACLADTHHGELWRLGQGAAWGAGGTLPGRDGWWDPSAGLDDAGRPRPLPAAPPADGLPAGRLGAHALAHLCGDVRVVGRYDAAGRAVPRGAR